MNRSERLAECALIDCMLVVQREKLPIDADAVDFESPMFSSRIHFQGSVPYAETVRLLHAYIRAAVKVEPGSEEIRFKHHYASMTPRGIQLKVQWMCRVRAYVDKATGQRCLEFSED